MARRFGIEVEYGGSIPQAAQALYAAGLSNSTSQAGYVGHSDTYWVVKADSSVPGGEMVSPPLDFDEVDQRRQVNKAIAALRSTGARTIPQAGIHVHIDATDLTADQVASVARLFVKFEDVIYRLASSGWHAMRPGARSYCKPMTEEQITRLTRVRSKEQLYYAYFGQRVRAGSSMSVSHGDTHRYCGINLQSWFYRGTIEWRVFNSSLNADRIQAYIAVCMALVQDARNGKKRSVTKAYRLGGMHAGTTNPEAAYHRFQQIVRYEGGMDLADYKLMNKCWKDSVPQEPINTGRW